jgi:UDP-glucose 4-epimerase
MADADIDGRTILVTGGAGFVGSHIAEALGEDNEVRVLDDLSSGTRENLPAEADLVEGDIRDPAVLEAAMEGVDLVFHQAAVVSVSESIEDPLSSHEVNTTATVQLLERARGWDARVVLASSCAVYGHPSGVPITEDEAATPTSPYGLQKLTLDWYARLYHDLYGLEAVPLRYFNVYGSRQRGGDYSGVIGTFVRQAREGSPITVDGDGEQTRDFVHVSDVVRANLLAATTDAVGEPFNVGTGRSVTIRELAELVRSAVGADVDIVHSDSRPGDIRHSRADTTKARDGLGFEAEVALEDGLERLTE